jgi:endonuclease YncB( thermonuclease family)
VANEDAAPTLARGYASFRSLQPDRVDQYGRPLRYVVPVRDKINVKIRLIAVGAAAPYLPAPAGQVCEPAGSSSQASAGEEARPLACLSPHSLQPR